MNFNRIVNLIRPVAVFRLQANRAYLPLSTSRLVSIDGQARRDLVIQASGRSGKRQRVGSFRSVLSSVDRDRRLLRARATQRHLRGRNRASRATRGASARKRNCTTKFADRCYRQGVCPRGSTSHRQRARGDRDREVRHKLRQSGRSAARKIRIRGVKHCYNRVAPRAQRICRVFRRAVRKVHRRGRGAAAIQIETDRSGLCSRAGRGHGRGKGHSAFYKDWVCARREHRRSRRRVYGLGKRRGRAPRKIPVTGIRGRDGMRTKRKIPHRNLRNVVGEIRGAKRTGSVEESHSAARQVSVNGRRHACRQRNRLAKRRRVRARSHAYRRAGRIYRLRQHAGSACCVIRVPPVCGRNRMRSAQKSRER